MDTKQPKKLPDYLKVIGDENRLAILKALKKGPLCVCEIFPLLNIPQNLASHHLKVLKDCSLVESKREGTKIIYSRKDQIIKRFQTLLANTL
jgi:DNA-binding transcriptional ArsR family regulator